MAATPRRRHSIYAVTLALIATVIVSITLMSFSLTNSLHVFDDLNPVSIALDRFPEVYSVDYPVEEAIPNPEPADGYNTFSACMLVMDDNHRLMEWFAYHYHVLPLRYLIVTIDPRSKTSPSSIFNKWRRQGVVIEEWTDRDFWRKDLKLLPIPDEAELQVKRDRHRGRQKYFYRKCLIRLKELNRTWVSLHDSDEFLLYNHAGGARYPAWQQRVEKNIEARRQRGEKDLKVIKPSQAPPTTAEEGGMIRYIRQEQAAGVEYFQSPCLGVPRLMFGAIESQPSERRHMVPNGVDVDQLDTLIWRRHARRNDFVKNALGKVIMDVSRIDVANSPQFMSLHRPIKSICAAPWHNDWESGLRINHYLGSWESYSFRDDSRRGGERSREQWEYKSTQDAELTDDNIRPWISGFVKTHGLARATELLDGAGLPKGYRNKNTTAWSLHPDKLKVILSSNETISNDGKMVAFDAWVRQKYKHLMNNR